MTPKPPPEALLLRAAEARAEGNSWKVVAEQVHRSPLTVCKWPRMYPDRWAAALREAERRAIDDAGAEGVCVLRELIRAGDPKVRQIAAWHLIYQRLEILKLELKAAAFAAAPPPEDAERIAQFARSHSNEQLIRIVTNLFQAGIPKCLVVPAHPPGSAA
jgi:hypothetical protein